MRLFTPLFVPTLQNLNYFIGVAQLQRTNCSLGHTLREGNRVADHLASMGVSQSDHVVILENPPDEVAALLIEDMTGVSFVRD
ncbi:hypothetical protein ACSBR2_014629 [Camellia fascicularis]